MKAFLQAAVEIYSLYDEKCIRVFSSRFPHSDTLLMKRIVTAGVGNGIPRMLAEALGDG